MTNPNGDADLRRVDGLTFDAFGHLYAALAPVAASTRLFVPGLLLLPRFRQRRGP